MQALLEAAEVGRVRSLDLSRGGLGVGGAGGGARRVPEVMTDRQLRALKALEKVWPLLGKDGSALATAVLMHGMLPEIYAARLGRVNRDDVRATGRAFKWALASLARHFGLAGG